MWKLVSGWVVEHGPAGAVAVRRAARLLTAFVEEAERKPRPGEPTW